MMLPEEISFVVSSDPDAGAVNRSADGSYFEIQLDDGLQIPKEALNVNVRVEEATIWWVVPNIITGQNDKMYITGEDAPVKTSYETMGFDANNTMSLTGAIFDILQSTGSALPVGAFLVGDTINVESGVLAGSSFVVQAINTDTTTQMNYEVLPSSSNQTVGNWTFSRTRPGVANAYALTIPQGLYDLSGLNQAIQRDLENLGARTDPEPLISFTPDSATQKVEMRINYDDVSVDFTQADTPRVILGFDSLVYGPYASAPIEILAPNIAQFNQINYFLVHSDLVNKGIRFNNRYNQTISQVLIDVAPGSQIIHKPQNPAKSNAQELAGAKRNNMRFYITDDKQRQVNTNGEYWTCRIVIDYLLPYVIGKGQ
tara:strand:- start:1721 stop:2833 length:1113 start_codon:yes stop_codon:yes gene_type:complete